MLFLDTLNKGTEVEFYRSTLSSGIPVIIVPTSAHLPFAFQITVVGGPLAEEENEHGIAHCAEHLLFRGGGEHFPDAQSVEREMWDLGREVEAFTMREAVVYYGLVAPSDARRLIRLFSEMFRFASIHPTDFKKERRVILQELGDVMDAPHRFLPSVLCQLLFGDNPLGREILGNAESIKKLRPEDVRAYKERYYGWPNIIISAAGPVNAKYTKTLIEEYFSPIPPKETAHPWPYRRSADTTPAIFIPRQGSNRAHILIGGVGPSYKDPDARAFELLHAVLSYRILVKTRIERSLCYDISAPVDTCADVGVFAAYTITNNTQREITRVLRIILGEMADIKSGLLDEQEVARAKNFIAGSLCLEMNGAEMIAHTVAKQEMRDGKIKSIEEQRREIFGVTRDDIVRLARDLWQEENVRSLLLAASFPRYEKTYIKLRSVLR